MMCWWTLGVQSLPYIFGRGKDAQTDYNLFYLFILMSFLAIISIIFKIYSWIMHITQEFW